VGLRLERRSALSLHGDRVRALQGILSTLLAAGVSTEHPHRPRRAFLAMGTGVAVLKNVCIRRVTKPRIA